MMQFPLSELDLDLYFKKVLQTLDDPDCKIFIDTNILAKYYVFHTQVRQELSDWLNQHIVQKKLRIPAWVLNEYSKHFIRKRTKEYLNDGNLVTKISGDFVTFKNFLTMYTEPAELTKFGYADQQALQKDMEDIQGKLEKFGKMKGARKEHDIKIHAEITNLFKDCILETDIFALSEEVSRSQSRYINELPPGFEDGGKENNPFGDLILWKEILNFCNKENVKKAVLITNDNKRDWVYAPHKIKIKGISKPNPQPNFKLLDPRLLYEFKLETNSEEIYIINLGALTQALLQNGHTGLYQLAQALQIDYIDEQKLKVANGEVTDIPDPVESALNTDESIAETIVEVNPVKTITEKARSPNLPYSEVALKDESFTDFTSSVIEGIYTELKSYDWYRQNPAIEKVSGLTDQVFKQNNETKDELFVLGRNIYQAACGGSFTGLNYLSSLADIVNDANPFIHEHLINGMFFELYFDSSGVFRQSNFKIGLIELLFAIKKRTQYDPYRFIELALEPYRKYLLTSPAGSRDPFIFDINGEEREDVDWMGKAGRINMISWNGENLLHPTEEELYLGTYLDEKDIKRLLEKALAIPVSMINLNLITPLDSVAHYSIAHHQVIRRDKVQ